MTRFSSVGCFVDHINFVSAFDERCVRQYELYREKPNTDYKEKQHGVTRKVVFAKVSADSGKKGLQKKNRKKKAK